MAIDVAAMRVQVEEQADGDDPLARLTAAVLLSGEVASVADTVVGLYVEEARAAGHSWADIGAALGVSKQAAQQRFVVDDEGMLSRILRRVKGGRFTDRARSAVIEAQAAARSLGHDWVGTEHLLLGLLAVPDDIGAQALAALGVEREAVAAEVESLIPRGEEPVGRHVPFTPRAKRVLEQTLREALQLGHHHLGTEHLLLALSADDGVAAQVLLSLHAPPERVRAEVVRLVRA